MNPPRQGLKVGHLVDDKRIVQIDSSGNIKVQDLSGVVALANAIKDMKALIKLDIRSNAIGAEQEQEGGLQRICMMASGIELAK